MQNGIEGLGINLIENDSPREDTPNVENFLPNEIKETEYKNLGNFVVLPTPYVETFDEKSEFFPNTNLKSSKFMFLIAGLNEETKKLDEALIVFEQLKSDNIVFTDPRPLEDWKKVLSEKEPKGFLYKVNKGYPTIAYDKWIIGAKEKYKISNVGISNDKPVYLEKNITQGKYEKILGLNKKAA